MRKEIKMRIYKIGTDAVLFSRYYILAEDVDGAIKKAKSIISIDEEIKDVEYIGEIAEKEE